jgi:CheY-like chemotaxis protein
MPKSGPIVIVDDDSDDQELMREILVEMQVKNEIISFENGKNALEYLRSTNDQPFFILCDINMPVMNGIEFRRQIDKSEHLRKKSIPFIFLSTTASSVVVLEAYELTVQGFFKKEQSVTGIKAMLQSIVEYWQRCRHPNAP